MAIDVKYEVVDDLKMIVSKRALCSIVRKMLMNIRIIFISKIMIP